MHYSTWLKRFLFILWWAGLLTVAHAAVNKPTILVLGDSLSASYGIAQNAGWVSLLQQRLDQRDYPYRVINASISGETTSGALSRAGRALDAHRPSIVIIELGGNDGLRGLPLKQIRANLAALIEASLAHDAQVLLVGMKLPPNYGPAYTEKFHQIYIDLARQYNVPLLPFLLEDVAQQARLMQSDGIHPRAEAQSVVLENVWSTLQPML